MSFRYVKDMPKIKWISNGSVYDVWDRISKRLDPFIYGVLQQTFYTNQNKQTLLFGNKVNADEHWGRLTIPLYSKQMRKIGIVFLYYDYFSEDIYYRIKLFERFERKYRCIYIHHMKLLIDDFVNNIYGLQMKGEMVNDISN